MVEVTVDTKVIGDLIIKILACIGVIAIAVVMVAGIMNVRSAAIPATPVPVPTIVPTPVPTPAPTPAVITAPAYPSVLTFVVLSATTSNGKYQVTTTSGNMLYFLDYATWSVIRPRATYTATLVGMEGSAYQVGTVNLLRSPIDYYYNSLNTYYYGSSTPYYYDEPYDYNYDRSNYYSGTDYPTYWHYGSRYYQCDKVGCDPMNYKQTIGEIVHQGYPPRPIRSEY